MSLSLFGIPSIDSNIKQIKAIINKTLQIDFPYLISFNTLLKLLFDSIILTFFKDLLFNTEITSFFFVGNSSEERIVEKDEKCSLLM